MRRLVLTGTIALVLALASPAVAAEHEVKMLNKGTEGVMVFEPALVRLQPGDTVKFVATDKSHNAESMKDMLPAGATPFVGKVNETVTVTFDKPGVYGIFCKPHYAMGMVALVVVGTPENEDAAKAVTHPGRARQIFASLFAKLAAQRAESK
jgi:pseudoazurin